MSEQAQTEFSVTIGPITHAQKNRLHHALHILNRRNVVWDPGKFSDDSYAFCDAFPGQAEPGEPSVSKLALHLHHAGIVLAPESGDLSPYAGINVGLGAWTVRIESVGWGSPRLAGAVISILKHEFGLAQDIGFGWSSADGRGGAVFCPADGVPEHTHATQWLQEREQAHIARRVEGTQTRRRAPGMR